MATTPTTQPSFVNIDLLPPVLYEKGKNPEDYLLKLNQHLLHISEWSQQLDLSVRNGWLVPNARVISITAEKITADSIFTQDLYIGSDQSIQIKGTTDTIDVYDSQATPELRTRIGKLGAGNDNYGQSWFNPAGTEIMRVGDTVFINGAIITNATIDASNKLVDTSIPTGKIQDSAVDENKRIAVYSQTSSRSSTNIVAGGVNQHTHAFTHNLGRKVVVVASYDSLTNNSDVLHVHTIRNQGTSGFTVENTTYNTSASTQSYSYTLRVDYW